MMGEEQGDRHMNIATARLVTSDRADGTHHVELMSRIDGTFTVVHSFEDFEGPEVFDFQAEVDARAKARAICVRLKGQGYRVA